jgi:antitoxin component of MazEF toxin-antitoxin module
MMAVTGRIRQWGNSLGLRLSKADLNELNIGVDDEVIVEIRKKENPLLELSKYFKEHNLKPITHASIRRARKELEGKYYNDYKRG